MVLLATMLLAAGALPASAQLASGGADSYRSTDGQMVHRPSKDGHSYGKITAICGDGSQSYSHHHSGTCSHHGGVRQWKNDPG